MRHHKGAALGAALCLFAGIAFAQRGSDLYAVQLTGPALAEKLLEKNNETNPNSSGGIRAMLASDTAATERARLLSAQKEMKSLLAERGFAVVDSSHVLLNAIYVRASLEQAKTLSSLPGVSRVERLYPIRKKINKALDLVTARTGWSQVGGAGNAGAGIKIGILDTGIDQDHPAFARFTATPPAGYPRCTAGNSDCSYTNNKVIAARNYVDLLNFIYGTNPADTRPDDNTPKDRNGHGTATAMIAAGQEFDSPIGRISGVAPRAFLGNYKVFGTDGVNSTTFANVVIKALEDALADGMDIVSLSLGSPAGRGPLDNYCGDTKNQPCDAYATALQNAIRSGLTIVIAAGNDGYLGANAPALNTIQTPGTAPGAITVGSSTNGHIWYNTVSVQGSGVPTELTAINGRFSSGPQVSSAITAPVIDVGKVGRDNLACDPLPDNSLNGGIALVALGTCFADVKVNNAQRAGAQAVVFTAVQGQSVGRIFGLDNTSIPSLMISLSSGTTLRNFLNNNSGRSLKLDPAYREVSASADEIAYDSSQGPSIGTFGIKPELVAVGTDLYLATQRLDPSGELYSPTGYAIGDGTSFAAPLVAGAAALVKQKSPSLSPAQVKSVIVNTANPALTDFDNSGRAVTAAVSAMGNGKLDTNKALQATVAFEPATIGFGNVTSGSLPSTGLVVSNLRTNQPVNLSVVVQQRNADSNARVTVAPSNFSVGPGGTTQLTVTLTGSRPRPGKYEGFLVFTGGAVPMTVPYTYFVGDGVPWNLYPLAGQSFDAYPGYEYNGILVKVVDQYGVPISGAPIRGSVIQGNGTITFADATTDFLGIAEASFRAGSSIGTQVVRFTSGNLYADFSANVFQLPAIATNGIVDAASNTASDGFAAGQYISIFGSTLAPALKSFSGSELALALSRVSVSFDEPSQRVSAPGRIQFVSPNQINVQIPWECQGLATVSMKVSIGDFSSAVQTLRLKTANPAFFEYFESGTNRRFVAALDGGFQLIGSNNPVPRGGVAQLYMNGLGPVSNTPGSGQVAKSSPLSNTTETPVVSIGGRPAQVLFSGLAPGIVGLYQVNVVVPQDAPTGTDVTLDLTISGSSAKTSRIAVR